MAYDGWGVGQTRGNCCRERLVAATEKKFEVTQKPLILIWSERFSSRAPFHQDVIFWPSNSSYHISNTLDYMPCELGGEKPLLWFALACVFSSLSRRPSLTNCPSLV